MLIIHALLVCSNLGVFVMKTPSRTFTAVLLTVSLPWLADSALAVPIAAPLSLQNAAVVPFQTVQWGHGGW